MLRREPDYLPLQHVLNLADLLLDLAAFQEVEIDFVADSPGLTLFHCHQQLHTDFCFMSLFEYV